MLFSDLLRRQVGDVCELFLKAVNYCARNYLFDHDFTFSYFPLDILLFCLILGFMLETVCHSVCNTDISPMVVLFSSQT